jgi:hypothetical protein
MLKAGSSLLCLYVRSVAVATFLLGIAGLFDLWGVRPLGIAVYLFSAVVFAYLGSGRIDDQRICDVVAGMGVLYLLSAAILISSYIFPSGAGQDLIQALIQVAFGVASILVAYICRGTVPNTNPERNQSDVWRRR